MFGKPGHCPRALLHGYLALPPLCGTQLLTQHELMDSGVGFEAFEEIVSYSDLDEDELGNEFEDNDIEETFLLEEIPEKHFPKKHDSEKGGNFCPFDILPEELIINIFSFLTVQELCKYVSVVCKLWLHYSKCPLLRQKLSLEKSNRVFSLEEISDFIKSTCPLLKELCLQPRTELSLHGCSILAQSCPYLQALSLSFCDQVTGHILGQFVTFCPNLRDMNLAGCAVTDHCLEGLNKLPLRKLNASHCTHLTDNGLKFLSTECHQLCYLNFDGVQWITHDAIAVLVENCCGHLEHLWLDGENMIDDTVELIVKCRHLKNLIKKKVIYYINYLLFFNSCRKLQSIDISWCWDVTDVGLEHVVHNCTQMVDMNICGAKDLRGKPMKEIPQCMPRLRRLDATQCNLVPDELLDELVSIMPQMIIINYYGEEVIPPKCLAGTPIVTQGGWCK
ncbi:F-box/LRR-repeat protein 2-like [Orbicella faveolata]|uniref:F-box/LRR-repeat protein 2-like n=1 Tax=Orbicella faveolata TaxID=48498 RepID=UPI0009E65EB3|nr:F-box/LRR-repeat protein 2-like [Orbicella faveolata]